MNNMDDGVALSCVVLLASMNACANVGEGATDTRPRSNVEHPAGTSASATPSAAGFQGEAGERALSHECEVSANGTELWRHQTGQDDPLLAMSVTTDASRNVFVATEREGLEKFDASGNPVWVRPFGSFVAAGSGDVVFVVGTFSDQLDLGSETPLVAAGGTDAYVAELDRDGAIVYAVALGGPVDEHATSVAAAPDGGAVVSAEGLGIVKLDATGRTAWTRPVQGQIAVDRAGNVVVTGALTGTQSFGSDELRSEGGEDVLVVKLSPDGEYLWSRAYGDTAANQRGEAIAVGDADSVLVGGVVDGTVDFGDGPISVRPGACPQEVSCKEAGFVLKLGAGGDLIWSRSRAPARAISGVAADLAGNVYVSGSAPGNVPPYRTPLLFTLDAEGNERPMAATYDMAGTGHAVATDVCGDVLFTFATPASSLEELGRSYVAKLFVP